MKKLYSLLALALMLMVGVTSANATKTFATLGAPAGNGAWDAETQTYTWTAGWSNLMPIFTFSNGELADYTALHLTTSDYVDGPYRVCFMNGSTAVATIAFYSAGEKNLIFAERSETKDIDLSQITAIQFGGASSAGSVKLDPASVYLVKPFVLSFGEDGKAHVTASDLDVTGNVTIDPLTGVVTSTGNGAISVSLPNSDFSYVTRVDVTRSGDDICNTMAINDAVNGNVNTWYGSKYGCDFTGYQSKAGQVNKITWNVNAAGTMTISDIVITSGIINGMVGYSLPDGATDALSFNSEIDKWNGTKVSYPTTFNVQGNFWGNNGTSTTNRVDVSSADYLSFVVTEGSTQGLALRVWVTDGTTTATLYAYPAAEAESVTNWGASYLIKEPGVYTVKISDWAYVSGIKADNNWGASPIVVALAYTSTGATPAICDMDSPILSLNGSGIITSSAKDILDNANSTLIDATGITGTGIKLTSANPNCIIKANAGVLANAQNVMVEGIINNLAITDGKPFALPAEATDATAASYDRVIDLPYSTVCLPFNATFTGKAYECTSANATAVTFTEVEGNTLTAGKAYLVKAGFSVTGGSGLAVAPATADFQGVYADTQNLNGKYGFSAAGEFVHITSDEVVCPAFRAYLTIDGANAAKLRMVISEETGIAGITATKTESIDAYNVAGQRVSNNAKGIVIINGKKFINK